MNDGRGPERSSTAIQPARTQSLQHRYGKADADPRKRCEQQRAAPNADGRAVAEEDDRNEAAEKRFLADRGQDAVSSDEATSDWTPPPLPIP